MTHKLPPALKNKTMQVSLAPWAMNEIMERRVKQSSNGHRQILSASEVMAEIIYAELRKSPKLAALETKHNTERDKERSKHYATVTSD